MPIHGMAIKLNPALADAYRLRGEAYTQLRQYDRALSDCIKLTELQPQEVAAYEDRMELLLITGRPDEAAKWIVQLKKSLPPDKILPSDRVIVTYFNCLIKIVKNETVTGEREKLNSRLDDNVVLDWDFEPIDGWLNAAKGLTPSQIEQIGALTERLKQVNRPDK